jgi:two-component system OmpR family response regulator
MAIHILLVEDEEVLASSIREFLEIKGFKIDVAYNGSQAVKRLQQDIPDIIISDISMPELDGYEFINAVRKNEKWQHLPFIFLTARESKDDQRQAMHQGADDFISKPFKFEELITAIHARLKRQKDILGVKPNSPELTKDEEAALTNLSKLSKKERRILKLIAEGHTSATIAQTLFVSPKTIENHRFSITKKLGLKGQGVLLKFVLKVRENL